MQCYQCGRNAMYMAGPEQTIPLCLDCYAKLEAMEARRLDDIGRLMNYMNAEMEDIAGLPNTGPRYQPRPRPVVITGAQVMNHVRITHSQIGVLNTGTIGSIDNAIGLIQDAGAGQVAQSLKALTEGVAGSMDLDVEKRREAVDLVSAIASEAATPSTRRRSAVAKALIVDLAQILSGIAATSQLWATHGPVIRAFFGIQ